MSKGKSLKGKLSKMPATVKNYFQRAGVNDKRSCKYVLDNATSGEKLIGWCHAQKMAIESRDIMNAAGASMYDADLAKKAVENPAAYDGKTWKDDPIEKARRVWEWWRAHRADPGITKFVMAARLVALVQVSSASVERTFS